MQWVVSESGRVAEEAVEQWGVGEYCDALRLRDVLLERPFRHASLLDASCMVYMTIDQWPPVGADV